MTIRESTSRRRARQALEPRDVTERQRVQAGAVDTAAGGVQPGAASVGEKIPNAPRTRRQRSGRGTLNSMLIPIDRAGTGDRCVDACLLDPARGRRHAGSSGR